MFLRSDAFAVAVGCSSLPEHVDRTTRFGHRAPGELGVLGPGGVCRSELGSLPGLGGWHRFPYNHDQRARRRRMGCRWHRS